jgi:hypothetical protein
LDPTAKSLKKEFSFKKQRYQLILAVFSLIIQLGVKSDPQPK